ncbi:MULTISPECIES: PAS domain S-box protein [Flavobacterium]|uniref:PAS domain S-box protein n=1 Tax=Flavobacterium keumense TaxID=1306518 RepID=A0ABY8N1V6_9FLAO|nr:MULTISPECIES: PAS domain S-box protein [Flavobacterium]WGK93635.1 PAS domain S-box protein [Flavobacterium keumense]
MGISILKLKLIIINLIYAMKISFENKIVLGFIINVLVVLSLAWTVFIRIKNQSAVISNLVLNWIIGFLFLLSILLLTVVYFIIKAQLRAKNNSQKLLLENQQLLQSIIDNASSLISIKKINGEYLLINKRYAAIYQVNDTKIIGKTDADFLDPELAYANRNSDMEVVKALKELQMEETIHQDNKKHTYLALKFPLYDSTGRIYAVGSIATDITERKKLEESLATSDKLFNMSTEMMLIASSEKFIKVNPATSKILGYTEKELLEQPFLNFVYPEDKKMTEQEVTKLKRGDITMQFKNRYLCKDGSIKWLQWATSPDTTTGLLYAVAQDITTLIELENEQENTINQLYENEEKLRIILENINDGILVASADNKTILANTMVNELLGIEEDEKISPNLINHFELFYPDGKTIFPSQNLPMERALLGEETNDIDLILWNPNTQEKRRVLISGKPLIDHNNRVVAGIITIKDISQYKKLEDELKETELKYRQLIGFKKGDEKE